MKTCKCACGATLAFLEPPELWEGQMLAHVRTKRHQKWSRTLHPGELPDDVELNFETIDRLKLTKIDVRAQQRSHEFEVGRLNRELVRMDTELTYHTETGSTVEAGDIHTSERLLDSLQVELEQLRFTYAEGHDLIKKHLLRIEEVKKQLVTLEKEAHEGYADKKGRYMEFLMDETRKQTARHESERAALDDVLVKIGEDIEAARERIKTAARLEVQFMSLKRDVEDLEDRYSGVEDRLAEAQYRRKYGEYDSTTPIQVEQSGFIPGKPARPNRLMTSLIGLLVGLGVGVGLAITRFKLDASYQQADDLRALMPGAVLVTIPEVRTSGVRIGRAIAGVLGGLALAGIFAATVVLLGIQVGWWGEPEMISVLTDLR